CVSTGRGHRGSGDAGSTEAAWMKAFPSSQRRRIARSEETVSIKTIENPLEYAPVEGYWDEALLPSGFPRRHWRKLFVEVGRMGFRELGRRWQSGQQLIQSQGVTYNRGNPADGSEYSWPMDPIPLPIEAQEWAAIERAAIQ